MNFTRELTDAFFCRLKEVHTSETVSNLLKYLETKTLRIYYALSLFCKSRVFAKMTYL